MDRDRARAAIKTGISCRDYLTKSKGANMYICPYCNSGTGKNKTGALKLYDSNTFTCHACGKSGDVIDLYQHIKGVDYNQALKDLAAQLNITIDRGFNNDMPNIPASASEPKAEPTEPAEPKTDYTEYYKQMRQNLTDPAAISYLSFRGLSKETAERYCLGYDANWQSPTALKGGKQPPKSPRLIIPIGKHNYIARDIRQNLTDNQKAYSKMKEGQELPLFNKKALYNDTGKPVFITEGEIDALSIIEVGSEAVALGSINNTKLLLEALKERPTENIIIISLDNDERGRPAADKLSKELLALNITHIKANICGEHKDPNEALTADKKAFIDAIQTAEHRTAKKPDAISDYLDRLLVGEIEAFKEGASRKTGFRELDRVAGGIYPGLYAIGAISSLGKTTFISQIADQMAENGEHVLFFSLEQSRLEMVSKSIARQSAIINMNTAINALQFRAGNFTQSALDAVKVYSERVKDRLSIIEGNFNCTVSFIGDYVRAYKERNGVKPIVIIDYLQIIQPGENVRGTKESIDYNITELKRLSRREDIPVFIISSLNRSNYLTPVDFESFKESGGIEYTADVVIGLQLQAINDDVFNSEKKIKEKREKIRQAKAENPRKIELLCLKNRYGISSYRLAFKYYPQYDYFVEDDGFIDADATDNPFNSAKTI